MLDVSSTFEKNVINKISEVSVMLSVWLVFTLLFLVCCAGIVRRARRDLSGTVAVLLKSALVTVAYLLVVVLLLWNKG